MSSDPPSEFKPPASPPVAAAAAALTNDSSDPPSKFKPRASPPAAAAAAAVVTRPNNVGAVFDDLEQHIDDKEVYLRIREMLLDIDRNMCKQSVKNSVNAQFALGVSIRLMNMHVENLVEAAARLPEVLGNKVDKVVKRMEKLQKHIDSDYHYDFEEIKKNAGEERDLCDQIECLYNNVAEWLPTLESLVK
jgi:hypothetical protein